MNGVPSVQPRRSSLSFSRRVSTGGSQLAQTAVSHSQNVNKTNTNVDNKLDSVMSEIASLKSINASIFESLAKLSELTQLLSGFRDENTLLRQSNERLKAENQQLKLALHRAESKQTDTAQTVHQVSPVNPEPISTEAVLRTVSQQPQTISNAEPLGGVMSSVISAVTPMKWLKVSNLNPSTTCEDVVTHVVSFTNLRRSSISCSLLTPKQLVNPFFASFKLGVPQSNLDAVFLRNAWPVNTELSEFVSVGAPRQNFPKVRPVASIS